MQKKNLKLLFLIVLYGCTLWVSKAQDTSQVSKKDTNKMLHWEVASDLLWLIDKNTSPKYNMMLRYNFKNKKGKYRAYRLQMGGNSYAHYNYEKTNLSILLGYEWQKRKKNFVIYYGADLSLFYTKELQKTNSNGIIQTNGNEAFGPYLIGFIGFKQFITDNITISLENSLNIGFLNATSSGEPLRNQYLNFLPINFVRISFYF